MKKFLFCLLYIWVSLARSVSAETDLSPLTLGGFGTLAYAVDDNDLLSPTRDITQDPGSNNARNGTGKMDSRLGLQMTYQLSPQLTGVAMVVLRDQTSDKPLHFLDLAYADYLATPDVRLRVGRIGYDAFLMSNHRNLGYAYSWVRPPIEFYNWIPLFYLDGGDFSYTIHQGDVDWLLRAQAGRSDLVIPMGALPFQFKADSLWGLSLQREQGPWRVKLGLSGIRSGSEVANLAEAHAGLDSIASQTFSPAIATEAAMLRHETSFKDARIRYTTLGVVYDDGTWFGQGELGHVQTDRTIAPQSKNGYIAVGRRFDELTPYVMFGISRPDRDIRSPAQNWLVLGPDAADLQDQTYSLIVNSTRLDQETLSLGMRWDFNPNAALKLQWDHTRIHPQGYAAWFRDRAVIGTESRVNLFSVSLDFVF